LTITNHKIWGYDEWLFEHTIFIKPVLMTTILWWTLDTLLVKLLSCRLINKKKYNIIINVNYKLYVKTNDTKIYYSRIILWYWYDNKQSDKQIIRSMNRQVLNICTLHIITTNEEYKVSGLAQIMGQFRWKVFYVCVTPKGMIWLWYFRFICWYNIMLV